jgi:hypothetical protein
MDPEMKLNTQVRNHKPGTDVMIIKNIFAEKFGENIGVLCSNYS